MENLKTELQISSAFLAQLIMSPCDMEEVNNAITLCAKIMASGKRDHHSEKNQSLHIAVFQK